MAQKRDKIVNTTIQAVFTSIAGLLMIVAAWALWSVGVLPAYVGAVCVFVAGLAILWFLAIQPVRALRAPPPVKLSKDIIEAHFDEDQLKTWALAIFGGVFLVITAVLASAWLIGLVPKGTNTLRSVGLFAVLAAVDALGVWGWVRAVRSIRNKQTFRGLRMRLAAKPAIDQPFALSIGPLTPRVRRLLDQSTLSLHLECWADLEYTTTRSIADARGRRRTQPDANSALEQVASLDIPLSQRVEQHEVHVKSTATPLSADRLRAVAKLMPRYVLAQKHYRDYEDFCERWNWVIRLRAGSRSCFFPLDLETIVAGRPIAGSLHDAEDA